MRLYARRDPAITRLLFILFVEGHGTGTNSTPRSCFWKSILGALTKCPDYVDVGRPSTKRKFPRLIFNGADVLDVQFGFSPADSGLVRTEL
jgi:hypothetical protein